MNNPITDHHQAIIGRVPLLQDRIEQPVTWVQIPQTEVHQHVVTRVYRGTAVKGVEECITVVGDKSCRIVRRTYGRLSVDQMRYKRDSIEHVLVEYIELKRQYKHSTHKKLVLSQARTARCRCKLQGFCAPDPTPIPP